MRTQPKSRLKEGRAGGKRPLRTMFNVYKFNSFSSIPLILTSPDPETKYGAVFVTYYLRGMHPKSRLKGKGVGGEKTPNKPGQHV